MLALLPELRRQAERYRDEMARVSRQRDTDRESDARLAELQGEALAKLDQRIGDDEPETREKFREVREQWSSLRESIRTSDLTA